MDECPCHEAPPDGSVLRFSWGKIYALGGSETELCIGEEFTPDAGEWKPLPQPPTDLPVERFCVSSPVIPDENNQRLLVHFDNARALYAYYPATETWDCLAHNFFTWWPARALADGVLYSHTGNGTMLSRDCITAYDILTKSWLKVVYSAYFPVNICVFEFTDMLHLGKDMFCLATA
ncbi:uncharacterized protein LOC110729024 isoform X2 [Chenopodium quinoa]|uniref:uncharacterized protein LOC110729024 isoform X2 n=1 Tax=Chenopodium quinoa TaxID=63459 RepID=UPI000B77F7E8|nr:uncharacterized protein LOC110729024 isoform X2 [Chenopodium quinoa]